MSVGRIASDGLVEEGDCLFEVAGGEPIRVRPPLQVQFVRGEILRTWSDQSPSRTAEPYPECTDNGARDVFLQREVILHFTIVGLRPEHDAVGGTDELRRHLDPITRASHAVLEYCRHTERVADGSDAELRSLERERRRSIGDLESRELSEIKDDKDWTLMVVEVDSRQAVHWMSPADATELGNLTDGTATVSPHRNGANFATVSGRVLFTRALPSAQLRALISIDGNDDAIASKDY